MNNKRNLLFILPAFTPLLVFIIILWANCFDNYNASVAAIFLGLTLMLFGFYSAICFFIASDENDDNSFADMLKDIGGVITTGIIGLLFYALGLSLLTNPAAFTSSILFNIVLYSNVGLTLLSVIGIITLLKFGSGDKNTIKNIIKLSLGGVCSIVGLIIFFINQNQILLVASITIFFLSIIESILAFMLEY